MSIRSYRVRLQYGDTSVEVEEASEYLRRADYYQIVQDARRELGLLGGPPPREEEDPIPAGIDPATPYVVVPCSCGVKRGSPLGTPITDHARDCQMRVASAVMGGTADQI